MNFLSAYRSGGVALVPVLSAIENGRQSEIADLHIPVLVDEYVGGLQVAMQNRRLRAVQPVHTKRQILHHLELLQQRDVNLGVVQQFVQGAGREKLSNDGEMSGLSAGTHEEDDVGMAQVTFTIGWGSVMC